MRYSGTLVQVKEWLSKLGPSFQSYEVTVEFQDPNFEDWHRSFAEYVKNLETKKEQAIERLRSKVAGARTLEELERLMRDLTRH